MLRNYSLKDVNLTLLPHHPKLYSHRLIVVEETLRLVPKEEVTTTAVISMSKSFS
jgi:hypothetical protein